MSEPAKILALFPADPPPDEPELPPTESDPERLARLAAKKAENAALEAGYMLDFEEWYAAYPRRVKRHHGLQMYLIRRREGADPAALLAAIALWAKHEWARREMQAIPHPGTFLNQRYDEDCADMKGVGHDQRMEKEAEGDRLWYGKIKQEVARWCEAQGLEPGHRFDIEMFAEKLVRSGKALDASVALACCHSLAVRKGWI